MSSVVLLIGSCLAGFAGPPETPVDAAGHYHWVYVGTYTNNGKSQGIYRLELDLATGKVTDRGLAAESVEPSFLAIHPSKKFLYCVNEVMRWKGTLDDTKIPKAIRPPLPPNANKVGQPVDVIKGAKAFEVEGGYVTGFALDAKTGALTKLNEEHCVGTAPCHLAIDATGKAMFVANYGDGVVAALPIGPDGKIGTVAASNHWEAPKTKPHAHSTNIDAGNHFVIVADLGLDSLFVLKFDPQRPTMEQPNPDRSAKLPTGSGPRHFAFHPDGKHGYVINETKSSVTAFDYDREKGVLTEIQTISTLPEGYSGRNSTAEVQVHPSGKFLYGSNRGHDSIAAFAIEPGTGRLKSLGQTPTGGKTPRNFGIDPTGQYLLAANQNSNTIVVFRIDNQSGSLMPTGQVVPVPVPVCVKFVPKAE
jgi:6-phosphogluconolactonase